MEAQKYFDKSEYSEIDFGSNPKLFSKKELIDFAEEYHQYRVIEQNKYLIKNFARQARPYQPTKKEKD